ncbi:MAG TPA: uL22 family ribosomal protein [Patescibacteria group bacterium]|nr:uL22 family ribosomal protein [Patescibacteria group bacterium]
MEVKASAKYLRVSPRKLRMLTRGLPGMRAEKALVRLKAYPQEGSEFLRKVVQQGLANAKNNLKLSPEKFVIKTIEVGEGPVFKRIDRSHGARFDRGIIRKKTAHIFLTLATGEEKPVEVKKEPAKAPKVAEVKKKAVSKKVKSKVKAE